MRAVFFSDFTFRSYVRCIIELIENGGAFFWNKKTVL